MKSRCLPALSISFNLLASASASIVSTVDLCALLGSPKVARKRLLLIVGGVLEPEGVGSDGVRGLSEDSSARNPLSLSITVKTLSGASR